jgi:flagellar biosynthesis anti-sigma factor FlgM
MPSKWSKGVCFEMMDKVSGVYGLKPLQKAKAVKAHGAAQANAEVDEVAFSPFAVELGRAMGQIDGIPDVRDAKIVELKDQVAKGNYRPNLEGVARSLLVAGILRGEE